MKKYRNYRILVTGGTGFIGSHVIEELLKLSDEIFVPYLEIVPNSYFTISKLKNKVHLTKLNLKDRIKVFSYLKANKINFIFHLAAQTLVTKAFLEPYETIENNIMSTLNILEYARINKSIKGVIIASSDKAYGKTTKAYNENSPLKGDHPYDVSKSAKDLIAQTYFKTYKTPVVITRFANVYGEGDMHLDRIIPGICEAISNNKKLQIRSDGSYVRDYIYVKDVAKAYILFFEKFDSIKGESYNISSNDSLSVVELIRIVEKSMHIKVPHVINNSAENEIPYQHLNWQKVKKLGWKPEYSLAKTIPAINLWYKKNLFIIK